MPPIPSDSESVDEIPKSKKPIDVLEDDEDDEDVEEDEYVVEKIMGHKYEGKTLLLLVKWKGYEKKSDMTWEPEENCEGAQEVVKEYFESIGGRPKYSASPAVGNKRGRLSSSTAPGSTAPNKKKAKTGGKESTSPAAEAEPKWKPPSGSWEDEIAAIDTIEKTEKGLICYVQWANGKKSQHEVHTVYKKAPQRMLKFYENHLVFKETTGTNLNYAETDD